MNVFDDGNWRLNYKNKNINLVRNVVFFQFFIKNEF